MKRHGLRQLTAALLCVLLCVTSFAPALAEDGIAVPMLPDQETPVMSIPVEPESTEAPVQAVKVKATVDGTTVNVSVTANTAYAVVVSLTQTDAFGKVTTYDSVTLKPGVVSARFDNVPVGIYTLTANYKTSDVPKAKAATAPIVIEAPVATAAPAVAPAPTAEPVQEPAVMPLPANDGDIAQLPDSSPVFDAPVASVPDASAPSDGPATLETPQDSPVQPMLPSVDLTPSQDDSTQQNPDIMPPMLPLEQAPMITEAPETPSASSTPETPEVPDAEGDGDTSGTDDPTLPGEEDPQLATVSTPEVSNQTVSGTVYKIQENHTVEVKLAPKDIAGTEYKKELLGVSGQDEYKYEFTDVKAGVYTLTITDTTDSNILFSIEITISEQVSSLLTIEANAQGGTTEITVNVTNASPDNEVTVELFKDEQTTNRTEKIAAGVGSVTFKDLAAGTYSVKIYYTNASAGVGATSIMNIIVTGELKPITITKVTPGENKLTVTGTAEPGSDITFTTKPASASTVVHVDSNGNFTAELVLAAGTYTDVYAQYGSDASSRVIASGTYEVTAPAEKPKLYVDPITTSDWIVYAKTTPGVKVHLGTYDHGTTIVADSRGILCFSMPHEYPKGTPITFTIYYGKDNVQSYQQVETVVGSISYKLLKKGSTGDAVYDLTLRLSDLGYPISPTHTYTDAVVAAVRLFQSLNGLAVDGMAGQLTQSALYSVWAIGYDETGVYPTLVRGNRGMALIYTLQQRLKDLGYYTIRVDGIFGSGTERAVRDFQRINGLTVTGRADNATQQLLYSSAALPAWYYGGSYGTLSRSNYYNSAVVPLQRRLRELGYYTGNIDGYFGSQTQRAVRNFQSRNDLSVTGVADSYTQQVLYSAAAKAASGSSASSTGYRLLYWGCKGDAVRRLQQALLDAGYTQVRVADGIYGQWTYDAVCAYQKAHGLAVDGIAGRNTQNSLYGTNY